MPVVDSEITRHILESSRRFTRLCLRLGYLTAGDLEAPAFWEVLGRISPEAARLSVFGWTTVDGNLRIIWMALRAGDLTMADLADRDEADRAQAAGDEAAARRECSAMAR